ncbi:P-loop containing nucleoside triphosphate hydrolase protein [Ochromonadaceae sp. CCMP2298]|nr:P-loop containing nucleoside triphosphate hydrolase protein [Ochromonadaceae sp. CCMP2298]
MMKPFVLRRLKSEVESRLPPKYETRVNCPMTELQRGLTRALLSKEEQLITRYYESKSKDKDEKEGEKGDRNLSAKKITLDKSRLLSLLAQLRKAANHPFLFAGIEKVSMDGLPSEEIVSVSGKMKVLDRLLRKLFEKGHRVVLFSQYTRMLDIISDYLDLRGYRHARLDGSTNRVMREVCNCTCIYVAMYLCVDSSSIL